MRRIAAVLSIVGLVLTVGPSLLVFKGMIGWSVHAHLMFAGMLLWFVCAPFWMREESRP